MKIHYMHPFALDKNLGKAYNDCFELIKSNDDYICFTDADTMFLTPDYGSQINRIVDDHPEAGLFTCLTNRVGNINQLYNGVVSENPDIKYHKRIAMSVREKYGHKVQKIHVPVSGHLMIIQKKFWLRCQFPDSGKLLGVDNIFSKKVLKMGYPILLMRGVYIFHYYRLCEGEKYKQHLK